MKHVILFFCTIWGLSLMGQQVLVPEDFPRYEDTGNQVLDTETYQRKCNDWIVQHPVRYAAIKKQLAEANQSDIRTAVAQSNPKPVEKASIHPEIYTEKWVLQDIKINTVLSKDTQDLLRKFNEQYFQKGNKLSIADNQAFQLLCNSGSITGKLLPKEAGLTMKIKSDNCEECYKEIEIIENTKDRDVWTWKLPSDFEQDNSVFELVFHLQESE